MISKEMYAQQVTSIQSETNIRFTMVGAGTADLTDGTDSVSQVTSAAYSATGLYAVILEQSGKTLIKADVSVRSATNNQIVYHGWDSATRTLSLRVFTAPNTAAAVALNDIVEFSLTFKDAS
jgi:hypothetical protein